MIEDKVDSLHQNKKWSHKRILMHMTIGQKMLRNVNI